MVDPGEKVTATLPREFAEEALDSESKTEEQQMELLDMLKDFFSKGKEVNGKKHGRILHRLL